MIERKLLTEKSGLAFRANYSLLSEDTKKEISSSGSMIVRGVPATILDEKNLNGRIYPEAVMRASIQEAHNDGAFTGRRLICTADDHPETTYPKPSDSSHVVVDAYIREIGGRKVLFNDWLILNTSKGKDLQALFKDGVSIGTSIRGLGRLREDDNTIQDYQYLGTDAVGQPSAGTYINPEEVKVSESVVLIEAVKNIHDIKEKFNNKSNMTMSTLQKEVASLKATKNLSEAVRKIIAIEKAAINSGEKLPSDFAKIKESVFARIAAKEEEDPKDVEGDKDVTTSQDQQPDPKLQDEEDESPEDSLDGGDQNVKTDKDDEDKTVTEEDDMDDKDEDDSEEDKKDDEAKTEAKSSKKLREQAKDIMNKSVRQNESLESLLTKTIAKNIVLEQERAKAVAVSEKILKKGVYTKEEMTKAVDAAIEAGVKSVSEMAEYVHEMVQSRAVKAIADLLESNDNLKKESVVKEKTFSKAFKYQSSIIESLVNKCKEIVEKDTKGYEYSRTVESKVGSKIGTDVSSKLFTGYKY